MILPYEDKEAHAHEDRLGRDRGDDDPFDFGFYRQFGALNFLCKNAGSSKKRLRRNF
jgi:hypothetical protein